MQSIREQFLADIGAASSADEVEAIRVRYVGRKGLVTTLRKKTDFRSMSPEDRRAFGQRFNQLKALVENEITVASERLTGASPIAVSADLDITLPALDRRLGALHPIALVQMQLEEIFNGMGFTVLPGYDVESEFFNFDGLNIPSDHPARDMQDTYWLTNGMVLRTHTSANQVRTMRTLGAPLKAIFPGRCFRYESVDATHENTFYQLEGLMVDREISVANLIAVMRGLLREIFESDVTVRLRPGFFPFVEPGFELDLRCLLCDGAGCSTCKTGWIELIPCGLVHPNVLRFGNIDPDTYSGFAFGLGLTRLAMMKFSIPEIRLFNSGDVRFCEQFATSL